MDPITIITAFTAALTLAESLVPKIKEMFSNEEITVEQQKELLDRFNSLKERANSEFTGPEWEVES